MSGHGPPTPEEGKARPDSTSFEIDRSVAGPERLHNYLHGGDDNFAVDRELGERLRTLSPAQLDSIRAVGSSVAAFTVRVVRYLIKETDVRQFLITFTPVPTERTNLHEIAQQLAPESRFVYVSPEPVVLAHAHVLRKSTPEGASDYIHGKLDDVSQMLSRAGGTLDLDRPVAFLFPLMSRFPDEDDPYGAVARLLEAVPSGSYLAVGQTTSDISTRVVTKAAELMSEALRQPWTLRTHAEVTRFFDGLELVEEGIVHIDRWRRHENRPIPDAEQLIPVYAGVGRKP